MKKHWIWIVLIAIIMLSAMLRIWQLGNVPPSPDWDEAALGYDAYSILHTGRDEFGKLLPVVLRSFDDYKPALYAYLTIPSIVIFGLNVFAVRFPSAVFGIISVIAVFFLVRELFEDYRFRDYLSLIASLFMAISPWSIQFSRVGFESNVGDALNILTVLFFIKGLKKPWMLFLSAVFAGLGIYVYQSEKVFTPLLVLALCLIYRKQILALSKKYLSLVFIFGLLVILPMGLFIVTNRAALLRVTGTSIFSYQTELLKTDIQKLKQDQINNDKLGLILDNRRVVYVVTIVSGYISHFDPNWLFVSGDISRHHAPNMGLLYIFEIPLILFGIYLLLFGDFNKKTKLTVFVWLLIAPMPASITTGVPHAVRTLNFLPTWQILSSLGLIGFLIHIWKMDIRHKIYDLKKLLLVLGLISFFIFTIINFAYYLDQYFVQLNYFDSQDWQFGYSQAVDEVKLLQNNYKEIVISDKQPMDKSYMFFLFYLQYSPSDYIKIGDNSSGGFATHHSFGKYIFRPIDWRKDSLKKGVLYIGNPDEIPEGASSKTIYNLDGTPAMRIAGT
jgi:4-amino-4-deoxy-L-arabinose transferase-like glycosyltransferase